MDRLIDIRLKFYRNLPMLVGVCLFMYFSYHSAYGHRSYSRLVDLTASMQQKANSLQALEQEHGAIEKKVVMMRPNSLSIDMLDEQVRYVLGYSGISDIVVISN